VRLLRTQKLAILDAEGNPGYLLGISEDITERKRAEEQLKIAASAFENTADGVIIYDARRCIVSVNKAFTAITGYEPQEVIGLPAAALRSEDHGKTFYESLWRVVNERGLWQGEMTRRRKNGEVYPVICSVSAVKDETGAIKNYVTVFHDISTFKQYEDKLEFLAHYDVLTQLPNRALFNDRFAEALLRAHRNHQAVAVMFLDLDRFKIINDSLGHTIGDELLQEVARRIKSCVRDSDVVARLGGDEFTLLLDALDNSENAAKVADKLLATLAMPFMLGGHELIVSASIGISCYPQDGADTAVLLKNADTAMYQAKAKGRNNYQFFAAQMNARALQRMQLEEALRRAVQLDEFLLHYQPKVDIVTGKISGIEALLRWAPAGKPLVSPAAFIPVLEETGLIVQVGEWVIREACRQINSWQQAGLDVVPPVAVNLSARQFRQKNLQSSVVAILEQNGVTPALLQFELTESLLMDDPQEAERVLRGLKQAGVKLSIDDFGTGYSSLAYLRRFPLDVLKIDRAFVKDIVANPDDAAITLAVISLAHSLSLKVVAEGVETEEQLNLLALHACDEIQGYYFSRPVPAAELEAMLREDRRLSRSSNWAQAKPAVLLVDDNPQDLQLLKHALRSEHYHVLTASSAEQAFMVLATCPVNVVVSDQHMPGMGGAEFLGKLRKLHPHAMRIAITGALDPETLATAVNEAGIHKLLSKGWSPERLRAEVQEAYKAAALAASNRLAIPELRG
jgi:diguanylate cyclase (GGDEF)-like protein/PAS domain S-box-containing protein